MVDAEGWGWGEGGGGGEVQQCGIDMLPLYRRNRQMLALCAPSHLSFPRLKSACLLPQAPRSVFSLIFDFPQTKFIAFLGLAR